jgi:hypothetical protein
MKSPRSDYPDRFLFPDLAKSSVIDDEAFEAELSGPVPLAKLGNDALGKMNQPGAAPADETATSIDQTRLR